MKKQNVIIPLGRLYREITNDDQEAGTKSISGVHRDFPPVKQRTGCCKLGSL